MEDYRPEQIRRTLSGAPRRPDLRTIQSQIDRVRREVGELNEILGGAAPERLSAESLLSQAEAIRARAANQLSTTASRATETAREHPVAGVAGLAVVLGIGLLALLFSRR